MTQSFPFHRLSQKTDAVGLTHQLERVAERMLTAGITYSKPLDTVPRVYEFQVTQPHERKPQMQAMAVIGKDLVFTGRISQEGSLELFGQVDGDVELHGPEATLMVNEGSVLKGAGKAAAIIVHGSTDATLQAGNVEIHPTATTRGAVHYDRISILGEGDNEITLKRNPIHKSA